MSTGPEGEIRCEARLENLEYFRAFVEQACRKSGGDPDACFALKLAVDEACTNIVLHGFRGVPPGEIALAFQDEGERLVVTITDGAAPFAPEKIPAPDRAPGWEERAHSGLGWHLIQRTMDSVEYRPDAEKGNRLVLAKRKRSAGTSP
ncbi:MAG: ATP-binding protein [Thermoanaerobaculia bacterium]